MLNSLFGSSMGLVFVLLTFLLGLFGLGCSVPLEGGGEISFGLRNDNFVVIRHTVDGDKEGKVSEAKLVIDQTIMDAILPSPSDDDETNTSVPVGGGTPAD